MPNVITESVEWFYPELAEQLDIDPKLGFLAVDVQLNFLRVVHPDRDETTVVGFADAMPEEDGIAYSITELDQVPKERRNVDRQGKGVGARLYNVPEALSGTPENPPTVVAYAVALDRDDILDLRRKWHQTRVGQVAMLGRHAARIAEAKTPWLGLGLEHLTDRLHESFGKARGVIQPLPPRSGMRRVLRGFQANPILTDAFMLIRDPNLPIERVGTYTRP